MVTSKMRDMLHALEKVLQQMIAVLLQMIKKIYNRRKFTKVYTMHEI